MNGHPTGAGPRVERVHVCAYRIPTEEPESDGTLAWDSTTLVLVRASAGGHEGIGWTYADTSTAVLIRDGLADVVRGIDALRVGDGWLRMVRSVRNLGRPGVASMAISAVDVALWDLKARLLGLPLVSLLGQVRDRVPVYGSGGFTWTAGAELAARCQRWVERGIPRVKIKVGRDPDDDARRVAVAREAIGPDAELFVDANGAHDRKRALAEAHRFAEHGVTWFEEPVPSDDLAGLRLLRDRVPPGMEVAAGEYGYDRVYFRRMLEAGAVDVLMPDATRCGGITGFLEAATLAAAFGVPVSSHCAPHLHLHPCCAIPGVRHVEYFHDHQRIERSLFGGADPPVDGSLAPDLERPGLGLDFEEDDAERYRVPLP